MSFEENLRQTAEQYGVQQEFWDIFGRPHRTSTATNQAILSALGLAISDDTALLHSVARKQETLWQGTLPPTIVVLIEEPIRIPLHFPPDQREAELSVQQEDGQTRAERVFVESLPVSGEKRIDGVLVVERQFEWKTPLPLGYHTIRCGPSTCRLIVAPASALKPRCRMAGLGVTLWALKSERNWGVGDFRDLREIVSWARAELHANFIALNPLHAIGNRRPYNSSPYLPNCTYYRNFLYLDVESIPGWEKVRAEFDTIETQKKRADLRGTETVEYERTAALKLEALTRIYKAAPPPAECDRWIESEGDLLQVFAVYSTLDEQLRHENPDLWIWPDWPERFRDPSSPAVREFARKHSERIRFHGWLQWLIDRQLADVQSYAKSLGMEIGLYHDLALATDRCGSDLWGHRPYYISGCRVGSPPDDFSPSGQDWSFPPPDTTRHREDGYRLYIESVRKTLRHGGALRIDHVMRLFRLYWIPEAHDATAGAYVRDRATDLVRILALESVRNGVIVIGEDLGTVEPEVRKALSEAGILSYRLLYFERRDGRYNLPHEYPEQALASTTTHDLPTIAGFWTGADIQARRDAGKVDDSGFHSQWRDRIRDKQSLLNALFEANLLPDGHEHDASRIPELTPELHNALVGFMATTSAMLWLINQEDLTKEPNQQNLPGTTAEYPNWSRKMRWSLEELRTVSEARNCAAMARNWVERTGRA